MPTMKLGRRAIATIEPAERTLTYWDSDVAGFGLRVFPSGKKSWICEYRAGAGGRGAIKRRLTLGSADGVMTPEAAREAAKDVLARVRLGADPAAERAEERAAETVRDVAEAWFERHILAKRKATTARHYRQVLETHIYPRIGTKRAVALTRQEVARLHSDIAVKGQAIRKEGAKPRASKKTPRGGKYAANQSLRILSSIFNWAADTGFVPEDHRNPARRIEKFEEVGRERFLSREELGRLGAAIKEAETIGIEWEIDETKPTAKHVPKERRTLITPHVAAALRLLIFTGMRLREVLNLEWAHYDQERGLLLLPDSKTGKKAIVLSSAVTDILDTLPQLGRYVVASESVGLPEEKPRTDIKKPWRLVTRRAGLEGLRIHDLRHSFASFGAGDGIGLPLIGGLLGHSDPKTTARYAHLAADPLRQAANAIADTIALSLNGGAEIVPFRKEV
ncbi:tyrosine-type recombinase/integrase [Oricola indica]|jgi:integrase|uniref:tyrosine-type recombinase/integrase n=1 Tax=Oricola indica TaxID=2872591 RepID=UPI001CBEC68B|nr:site-specific integrase [Oricola indica]